jgi:putative tryptophan/tyrosine transport system substrate-binding protein
MKRREFIVALAGTMVLSRIAFAEPANKTRLVGYVGTYLPDDPLGAKVRAAFNDQIRDLGWVEGQNLQIEHRWAHGDPDRANELAKELVGLAPDVIVATSTLTLAPLARQTRTIPIVFVGVGDPIGLESLIKKFVSHVSQVLGREFSLVVPGVEGSFSCADGSGDWRVRVGRIG